MTENEIITVWERYNENSNRWEFNHISNGFSESEEKPKPNGNIQEKSWPGGKWRKFKAHLEGIAVVREAE